MIEDDFIWIQKLFSILGITATKSEWLKKIDEARNTLEYEAQFEASVKSESQILREAFRRVMGFYINSAGNDMPCEVKVSASDILLEHQQADVAIALLQPIDENGSASYYINFGRALLQMGILDQSQQFFIRAVEIARQAPEPLYYIGLHSCISGDANVAIKAYQESLKRDPLFLASIHNLSYLFFQAEKFDSVVELCLKAIQCGSEDIEVYLTLCASYGMKGESEQCLKYTKLLREKFARDKLKDHELEAVSCFVLEDYKHAVTLVNRSLNMRPDIIERNTIQAVKNMELQNWEEALVAIESLLSTDPNCIDNLEWRFIALFASERWEEAQQAYTKLIDIAPFLRVKFEAESAKLRIKLAIVSGC